MPVSFAEPGDIALCRHNVLGIVTKIDGKKAIGKALSGFFIYEGKAHGHDWESVDPKIVGHIDLNDLGDRCNA